MSSPSAKRVVLVKDVVQIHCPPLNTITMSNIRNINHCCGGNILYFTIIADGCKLTSRIVKSDTYLNKKQVEKQCLGIAESIVKKFGGKDFKYVLVRLTLSYDDSHAIMKWKDFIGNVGGCVSDIVDNI